MPLKEKPCAGLERKLIRSFYESLFSLEMKYLEQFLGCITFCHERNRNIRGRSQVHSIAEHIHDYQKLGRTCRKNAEKYICQS
jgi:hypothetical protein